MSASAPSLHHEVMRLIRARDWPAAATACAVLNARQPQLAAGWIAAGQIALALARVTEAREAAAAAERGAGADPVLWDAIGTLYSHANAQSRALAAYDQALALAPSNPQFLFNRASVHRFVGALAEAEADYDRVIALRPTDCEAHHNRSQLRTQTHERNHVGELEDLLARTNPDWRGAIQLHYALAKEYEDLGAYEKSFQQLQRGAQIRRQHLRYDVATDVATVDWIMRAFPAVTPASVAAPAAGPIFILGLPRSGSTLVERILGSHSQVYAAGELKCLALAIVDAVRASSARAQMTRQELVAAAARLDFAALGRDYLARARAAGAVGPRFVDKMPLNYLYCGLILRALPEARIVHVSRHPMAACYAIYKTLFEDAYPFSYDLTELGRYYVAYHRLMAHWQMTSPAAILQLGYEELIADQIGQTRRLLEFCGLEWEPGCVQFHRNPQASTTASAAQVRRPIYDSSVSQWRHYESQLTPLRRELSSGGICVD